MSTILFLLLFVFSFLLSGISMDTRNITHVLIFTTLVCGFVIHYKSGNKSRLPPNFLVLLLFTVILQIYLPIIDNRTNHFHYTLLFTEGLGLWFLTYNLKKEFIDHLYLTFVIPAFLYALIWLLAYVMNINLLRIAARFFSPGEIIDHTQIGNLWVLPVVFAMGSRIMKKDFIYELLYYFMGIYFIVISKSRSAAISLITPLYFMFSQTIYYKKYWKVVLVMTLALVIFISSGRSALFSRPYFLQSIIGFRQHPLGIGMGNFGSISEIFYRSGGVLGSYSSATHNVFLEALSGVGLFSLIFIYWGYKTFTDVFSQIKSKHIGWVSVFAAVSIMFMIDTSYIIPGMFWLWFISLGVSQRSDLVSNRQT